MTASAIPRCGSLGPSGLGVVLQVVCELFWIGASVKYLTFTFTWLQTVEYAKLETAEV